MYDNLNVTTAKANSDRGQSKVKKITPIVVNKFTDTTQMRITKESFICEDENYNTFKLKANSHKKNDLLSPIRDSFPKYQPSMPTTVRINKKKP